MNARLARRVDEARSRMLVRRWAYRQRRHARGVWFRLRRVLADASDAYAISCDEAKRLVAEGYAAQAVGAELEPPKVIVFAPAERVRRIAGARTVPVRLGGDLLEAGYLVLTPFAEEGSSARSR